MADYTSVAAVKAYIDRSKTTDDATLALLISGISRSIDRFCNRPDGFLASTATQRTFAGSGLGIQRIDECASITAVAVKESATDDTYTAWTTADWIAFSGDERFPDFNRTPYEFLMANPIGDYSVFTSGQWTTRGGFRPSINQPRGLPTVRVTAYWGYALTTPADIALACSIEVARAYKRGQSAFQDATAGDGFGALMYQHKLDKTTEQLLVEGRYVRPTIA